MAVSGKVTGSGRAKMLTSHRTVNVFGVTLVGVKKFVASETKAMMSPFAEIDGANERPLAGSPAEALPMRPAETSTGVRSGTDGWPRSTAKIRQLSAFETCWPMQVSLWSGGVTPKLAASLANAT